MFGCRHHAARDRQHLLLAAGQQAGAAVQAIAQPRKAFQQRLDFDGIVHVLAGVGAKFEVVVDRQFRKYLTAFRHQREAARGNPVRFAAFDAAVIENDFTVDRPQQSGDGAHQRRLAGAIGADQRHHFSGPHLDIHLLQHGCCAITRGEIDGGQHRILRPVPGLLPRPRAGFRGAEIGRENLCIVPDLIRRSGRDWPAGIEHHDVIGDSHHQTHVVLDQNDGDAGIRDPAQQSAQAVLVR